MNSVGIVFYIIRYDYEDVKMKTQIPLGEKTKKNLVQFLKKLPYLMTKENALPWKNVS